MKSIMKNIMPRNTRGSSVTENVATIKLTPRRYSFDYGYNETTIFSNFNRDNVQNSYNSTSLQTPNSSSSFNINLNITQNIPSSKLFQLSDGKSLREKSVPSEESEWMALGQLLVPFLIAGLGNVAAGIILDKVQHWEVFEKIPQLIILVPALIGLKGNVEMTLASRLSTHSNLGHMDSVKELKSIITGNMALVQCQASVVGLIAPLFAIALSFITKAKNDISFNEVIIVTASSVITANIANLLLGTLMCVVVILSRRFHVNPDNIGTPIAASLGDFTTMLLLAYISRSLFETFNWLSTIFLILLMVITPLWAVIARRVSYTKSVIYTGWLPILGAMMLQNTGGLIMENSLTQFERIAAFQPVINGVGGNLVAIQSSRMSTYLHKNKNTNKLSSSDSKNCNSIFGTFFGKNRHALMARLLLMISGPCHIFFLFALRILKGHFIFTFPFLAFYILAALIQICILLQLCNCLVHFIFRKGLDPDCFAIPFLTAFADLLGSALLAFAFFLLYNLNDANAFDENTFANITLTNNQTFS